MVLYEDKCEYILWYLAKKRNPLYELPFVHEQFQYTTSTDTIPTPVDQLRDLGITVSSDSRLVRRRRTPPSPGDFATPNAADTPRRTSAYGLHFLTSK